jgi:hypothetical protein
MVYSKNLDILIKPKCGRAFYNSSKLLPSSLISGGAFPELMDTSENLYHWIGGVGGEKNRHHSREFKRDAVQLVTEKWMPVGKLA